MIDLVETVKFFGGLAGLGTAGFTIYDRLLRSRPIVSICAAEHYGEGAAYLRVKNRSEFDIVLTAIDASRPTRVSLRDDRVSAVKSALGMTQYRALAPGETAQLDVTCRMTTASALSDRAMTSRLQFGGTGRPAPLG